MKQFEGNVPLSCVNSLLEIAKFNNWEGVKVFLTQDHERHTLVVVYDTKEERVERERGR